MSTPIKVNPAPRDQGRPAPPPRLTTSRSPHLPNSPLLPAFTLVELIVVIIILSVAAAMIAPRLIRRDQRRAERIAERCADLLRAAATRASISADAVAVQHDQDALRVLSPVRAEGFTQSWAQRLRWRVDPLIPPVPLDPLTIDEFLVDARRSRDGWAILGPAGAASISLTLRPSDAAADSTVWRIHADIRSAAVELLDQARPDPSIVDLDAAGLRDTPW